MTGDLMINGKDAYTVWGVCMGDGFLDAVFAPDALKAFVENKSRLEDGKQVLYGNPRMEDRDLTLVFNLEGKSESDYFSKYRAFKAELCRGPVVVRILVLGETYRFTYQKSAGFAMNAARTFGKISVKFNEPDPTNRSND